MPQLGQAIALPFNPRNYQVPSRISLWAQTICPDGSLDTAFELGSVQDIEFIPNENRLSLDSARTGTLTSDADYITRVDGDFKFTLQELVGTNLELLFRPQTITDRSTTLQTVFGQSRVQLPGTTAVQYALEAFEPDPTTGVAWLDAPVVDVRDITGATTYVETTDYTVDELVDSGGTTDFPTITRLGGGSIADGEEVVVRYTFQREATAYSILDGQILEVALTLQILSVNGPQSLYKFFRTSLSQDGSILTNPEERKTATINAKILPRGDGQRGEFILLNNFARFALSDCT